METVLRGTGAKRVRQHENVLRKRSAAAADGACQRQIEGDTVFFSNFLLDIQIDHG